MRASITRIYSSLLQAPSVRAATLGLQPATLRTIQTVSPLAAAQAVARKHERDDERRDEGQKTEQEEGAMTRRLAEMTEERVDVGGLSAAKNIEAAGFSEELKKQLQSRIEGSAFRSQNQRAFVEVDMPVCNPLPALGCLHKI
jgi:hypothetical protein